MEVSKILTMRAKKVGSDGRTSADEESPLDCDVSWHESGDVIPGAVDALARDLICESDWVERLYGMEFSNIAEKTVEYTNANEMKAHAARFPEVYRSPSINLSRKLSGFQINCKVLVVSKL